jgi:hypothetical protein
VQLHTWLSRHTGRHLSITAQSTRCVVRTDNITVQPEGGQSIQTGPKGSDPVSWSRRMSTCQHSEIHRETDAIYVTAWATVAQWLCMFWMDRQQMMDMVRTGQAYTVTNPKNTAQVANTVCKDRHQIVCSLSMEMNMSGGTMHTIIQDLEYCKVCSQWVLHIWQTHTWSNTRPYHWDSLQYHLTQGDAFLQQTALGDATWHHHSEATRQPAGMQWGHPTEPQPSHKYLPGKLPLLCFLTLRDPLLLDFKPR